MVLVYNEMWARNAVYDLLEKMSGEHIPRHYDSLEVLQERIVDAEAKLKDDPNNFMLFVQQVGSQYLISMGIRGDNTPEYAKYLGYLTSKDLYPDFEFTKFEDYLQLVLDGKAQGIYEERKKEIAAAVKQSHE